MNRRHKLIEMLDKLVLIKCSVKASKVVLRCRKVGMLSHKKSIRWGMLRVGHSNEGHSTRVYFWSFMNYEGGEWCTNLTEWLLSLQKGASRPGQEERKIFPRGDWQCTETNANSVLFYSLLFIPYAHWNRYIDLPVKTEQGWYNRFNWYNW